MPLQVASGVHQRPTIPITANVGMAGTPVGLPHGEGHEKGRAKHAFSAPTTCPSSGSTDPGHDPGRAVGVPQRKTVAPRVNIIPPTEAIARHASELLAAAGLHGHKYALDALVAATALASPPP